ncbi:multiheme c-type cytochrome [Rhodohalobacter sp. 8-1]|uniref:multiheme c-type cytochrome n=1 Tax=Rhodohalobacter sp. 8-1 TaxID=3131972 RepID=UPI0030ED4293
MMRMIQLPYQNPIVTVGFLMVSLALFFLMYSCGQTGEDLKNNNQDVFEVTRDHAFVGDQTCQSCHGQEWDAWKGSHHDYAIGEADDEHVRGDFEDAEFSQGENSYRFYRDGQNYMVDATEQGESETYTIDYTFGWEPLQQYLINIGDGKIQALHIAWDTEENRWFSLQPDEKYASDDWMHWTGGSMNWNTMCADCHSTNLKQNYIAEAD